MVRSRWILVLIALAVAISRGSAAAAGLRAELAFQGPGLLEEDRSGVARGQYVCTLGTGGDMVTGWSFGVVGVGLSRVTATTSETVLDQVPGAVVVLEEIEGTDGPGVFCSVTLPAPMSLRHERVLVLDAEMEPELTNATAVLRLARFHGPLGTVRNVVLEENGSEVPIALWYEKRIAGRTPEPCGEAMLGFSSTDVESEDGFPPERALQGAACGQLPCRLRRECGQPGRHVGCDLCPRPPVPGWSEPRGAVPGLRA